MINKGRCCEADGASVHRVFNHEIPVQSYSKTPPGPNECHEPALITHIIMTTKY